ncbi:class I SAM-dependent methyltransferase [Clostridium sp. D2Q-11]|uniref:Class I SAM-dependent methyltransferase n=1 Tax=Anaeromonas frigoriresistens TaxID=2683708 RepID=A0A942Z816_9FIRM|nr:class I SAM-dependent methyltransferase [Anaeromonas frigoriresistens]MBS4540126.1 class I SAM-dependent methyltransferase [Anaeromonas frigoriresistens]
MEITIRKKHRKLNHYKTRGCPLCRSINTKFFYKGKKRDNYRSYFCCNNCDLVFVDKWQQLNKFDELSRYKEHNNDPNDKGYRKFLSRLIKELIPYLNEGMLGLDYGCGPVPALSMIMRNKRYNMKIYDPYFYRRKRVLNERFDFITSSEVIEHFNNPYGEFIRLNKLLKKNGYLAIMTNLLNDKENFKNWHYKNDLTHISFYSKETMRWIANKFNYKVFFPNRNVIIFKKIRGGQL